MLSLFKNPRIRKYYYLVLYPLYLFFGILRYIHFIPKKYVIYGAAEGYEFIDNSKYSYLLNKNDPTCVWITHSASLAKKLRHNGYKAYFSFGALGVYYQIFSRMAVISHGIQDIIPIFLLNIPILQYWHGCPIKKIGIDMNQSTNITIGNKIWIFIYKFYPHLNYYYCNYFVNNSKQINYQKTFETKNTKFIQIPYPRLAPLFNTETNNVELSNEQLDELIALKSQGKEIVIYMPTYRITHYNKKRYQEELLKLAKIFSNDDRIVFVYKPHFLLKNQLENKSHKIFEYYDPDPYPLLALSSALITDYSSIVFDYLYVKKPLCLFTFDKVTYEKYFGFYYDLDTTFGSIIANDYLEVYSRITSELFDNKQNEKEKESILKNLFFESFYKDAPFNINSIEQSFRNMDD